jgi:hypothetical protein
MPTKTRRHRHQGLASNGNLQEGPAENTAHAGHEDSPEERFHLIQIRAYGLWEEAGKPGGDAARERCWYQAETEILAPHAWDE